MNVEVLWWTAGRLAARGDGADGAVTPGWGQAVHRAAQLLQPAWPEEMSDNDPVLGLEVLALLLYARGDEHGGVGKVPLEVLLGDLEGGTLAELLRGHLRARGNHTGADDRVAELLESLATYHQPSADDQADLPGLGRTHPPGPNLEWGSGWAASMLRWHHRPATPSNER